MEGFDSMGLCCEGGRLMITLIILWKDREPENLEVHYRGEAISLIEEFLSDPNVKKIIAIRGSTN